MKKPTPSTQRDLGEAIALLRSNPRACFTRLARLRRQAVRQGNANDAIGLLALMIRAARASKDRSLALRLSQRLVREDPARASWWSTLALVEYEIAFAQYRGASRNAERYFKRAAKHYARAAEIEEVNGEKTEVARFREFEASALERAKAAAQTE